MYENGFENDTPPERIWLQWYQEYQVSYDDDDEIEIVSATPPLVANHPDDRTWCDEPVHEHDIAYVQTAVHDAEVARLREQIDAQAAEIARLRLIANGTDDGRLHAIARLIAELQEVEARAKRHDDMTKAKPADVVADLKAQIAQMQEVAK
jgi:uncharacterized membrane protein YccC